MAPPPEYDKEPKAPDKSATNVSCEETKTVHSQVNDQPSNSDNKSAGAAANAEAENNKLVETLDDGQLRALLDEAITYKCPKDREGKSNLFKELLEEVELDEQASEAAARGAGVRTATRAPPRPSRSRRALPHSNSLQDLVAALAAEPVPRRHRPAPAPAPAPVSTRAIHGGSLPSGVDTSFLLGEEPIGGGYLATVRCVNPPPLNERRVSTTDASASAEVEMLTRRSKPAAFPMTYTARATLEIQAPPPPRAAAAPSPAHQVPYLRRNATIPPRKENPPPPLTKRMKEPKTTDPQWKLLRSLKGTKKLATTAKKAKGKRKSKPKKTPLRNEYQEKAPIVSSDPQWDFMRPSNKTQAPSKSSHPTINSNQKKAPGTLTWVIGPPKILPEVHGPKQNTSQISKPKAAYQKISSSTFQAPEKRSKTWTRSVPNYYKEGSSTLPIEIPQRSDHSYYYNPQQMLYSYSRLPTIGPPERLYTQKVYNPRCMRYYKKKRFLSGELENKALYGNIIEDNFGSVTSESDYATANTMRDQQLTDSADLNSSLDNDSTELNFSLPDDELDFNQCKLLNALFSKLVIDKENGGDGKNENNKDSTKEVKIVEKEARKQIKDVPNVIKQLPNKVKSSKITKETKIDITEKIVEREAGKQINNAPKVLKELTSKATREKNIKSKFSFNYMKTSEERGKPKQDAVDVEWSTNVNNWYGTLEEYAPLPSLYGDNFTNASRLQQAVRQKAGRNYRNFPETELVPQAPKDIIDSKGISEISAPQDDRFKWTEYYDNTNESIVSFPLKSASHMKRNNEKQVKKEFNTTKYDTYQRQNYTGDKVHFMLDTADDYLYGDDYNYKYDYGYVEPVNNNTFRKRQDYRERIGKYVSYIKKDVNPTNIRRMTIGKSFQEFEDNDIIVKESIKDITQSEQTTKKDVNILPIDDQMKLDTDILDSSNNGNKLVEDLKDVNEINEKNTELPPRSSTPIFDKNNDIESASDVKNSKEEEVDAESKEHPVENAENNKGTVNIPLVTQTECVTLEIDEGLLTDFCSSSHDKGEPGGESVELIDIAAKETKEKLFELKSIVSPLSKPLFENMSGTSASHDKQQLTPIGRELIETPVNSGTEDTSFATYLAEQQRLFKALEDSDLVDSACKHSLVSILNNSEKVQYAKDESSKCVSVDVQVNDEESQNVTNRIIPKNEPKNSNEQNLDTEQIGVSNDVVILVNESAVSGEPFLYMSEDLPNNSCVFLTLPQNLLAQISNIEGTIPLQIEYNKKRNKKSKKKINPAVDSTKRKEQMHKNALRSLLFEDLFKRDGTASKSKGKSSVTIKEVDSTIPFSCITTPEVVASCITTPSTAQSVVALDPKPLQLSSSYRAVASLTGEPAPAPTAARPHSLACLCCRPASTSAPRSVVSSSFNGLPLSRPNYGSTASTTQDEFKKSLDENGNSVQGYSSPLSGSSQHKKPRRKKSSKNETVIKSHQIDGYQGNKDLNEVLRFIESNAESTRAGKLNRAKHKDDSDDKGGKKRSTERRKDKESKMKRATSMEELSRTKLEDLTDKPGKKERRNDTAPKAERRSWGDDARDSFYYHEMEPTDADFQTVTKKRKPRRRADETLETVEQSSGDPPRAARQPSPRPRRVSAPPSDRSNDSNDDMDSVHSLPADAPKTTSTHAPVSYADIARTRHNIPDLIESCNFYAEGEVRMERVERPECVPPAPIDADGYPALEPRAQRRQSSNNKPNTVTTTVKHSRKSERSDTCGCIWAPDVVAEGRPPVILLDSARAKDMDGVTFGFDINQQLLGGPTRRPRCDLVRDAIEVTTLPPEANGPTCIEPASPPEPSAVDARVDAADLLVVGCAALRYMAPKPPADTTHLHQIIDYVGAAWEDVVRCGGGKVRYYSE